MNAAQAQKLESAARGAVSALAFDSAERLVLEAALAALAVKSTGRDKCVLCAEGFDDDEVRVQGFLAKHLKPGAAHGACAADYHRRAADFAAVCDELRARNANSARTFDRIAMSICACGHSAGEHLADELENLLACEARGCDCDHFHYEIEERDAA